MEKIQESSKFAFLYRGVAQSGSVHVWGACGRRFKSCHPDLIIKELRCQKS